MVDRHGFLGEGATGPLRDREGGRWGLDASAFELPPADELLASPEAEAVAEIKLAPRRAIGYGCVRVEQPDRFAELLLGQANGWPASKVKDLWDNSVNSAVTLDHKIPVHLTYFTAVVDETGKVVTFADLYGLDNKLATALFGNVKGFPMPPSESKRSRGQEANAPASGKRTASSNDLADSLQGFLGD